MKKLEIQLTESVNGVAFGTDRTVVRHAFGNDYAEFKKSSSSKNTTPEMRLYLISRIPKNV